MTSILDRLAHHGYARVQANGRKYRINLYPGDLSSDDQETIAGTASLIDSLREYRRGLVEDGRYSPEGVREKVEEKAAEFVSTSFEPGQDRYDNLSNLDTYATDAADEADRLRAKASKLQTPAAAEEADERRDREVREYLRRDLDSSERRKKLRKAVKNGREDLVRAAVIGPPELSGLTSDQQQEFRELWLRHQHPELVEKLEAAEQRARRLEKNRLQIANALKAVAEEDVEGAEAAA